MSAVDDDPSAAGADQTADGAADGAAEGAAQRDREQRAAQVRLDEIFGNVSGQTRDDLVDPADLQAAQTSDEWWLRQVPPHHG